MSSATDSSIGGRSAPVLEFICLFTHDLRRKQKRWQDGRLKYHTFNKRIMVYDDRRNFVGDMHWQCEWELDEGEEVQLERGGVIVQVAECVGRQDQDLSELLDKRAREKEQRQLRVGMHSSLSAASPRTPSSGPRDHFQTRHRPLNQLVGTPTGHHGRALVPKESPFELRQRANEMHNDRTDARPSKRRKHDITPPSKMGYAQSLFGAPLTLSAVPISSALPRRPTVLTPRIQPEVPPRQEEAMPDTKTSREGQRLHSPKANTRPSLPKAFQKSNGSASLPGRDSPESTAATLDRPRPEKVIPGPQMATPTAATLGHHRLDVVRRDVATAARNNSRLASKRPENPPAVRNPPSIIETAQTDVSNGRRVNTRLKLGVSCSKAIVLDDDDDDDDGRPEKMGPGSELLAGTNNTAVSKPQAPSVGRQNMGARPHLPPPPLATELSRVEAPPNEERTELRLKPRQKRGLLLLSEKKNRTKQPKRQDPLARDLTPTSSYSAPQTKAAASEVRPQFGPGTPDLWSTPRPGDPSPSPPVPEYSLLEESPRQPFQEPAGVDSWSRSTCVPEPGQQSTNVPPSLLGPSPEATDKPGDELMNLSPSPKRRRLRRETKTRPRTHMESDETTSSVELIADPTPESGNLKPTRRTRKAKSSSDDVSSKSRKRVLMGEKEASENEELPRVPSRPRLARLNRKSVRSREVIGYVPSSPPVINPAILGEPASEPLGGPGPLLATNGIAIGAADSANPAGTVDGVLSVSDGAGNLAEKTRHPTPSTTSSPEPAPAPKDSSPTNAKMVETVAHDSREDRRRNPTKQQLVDILSPHEPTGGGSEALVVGVNRGDSTELGTVPDVQNIAPETIQLSGGDQKRLATIEAVPLSSQLHKSHILLDEAQHPISDTHDTGVVSCVTDDPNNAPPDLASAGTSRPRITNPASRGRKAALRSDAAGKVPQSILAVEPVQVRTDMRPPAAVPQNVVPDPNERPKRKMTFPGFVSAKSGGGPWSREAHDLLGSARPC
ncbi:hypothetical protein BT67DRAFT_51922 [Trichocladium antarcticum]|uniref:5'-3' DNA helicase ZGRF1-like N-terminal domain-containing protein n=1 Tax=Trichocladium antarcticum TaxID=1450529 RepID=A0AAN6UIE9_9PEZI|nr:hypothetical protein BT67DRAFT_51922 [Trichocladium antarcticum]